MKDTVGLLLLVGILLMLVVLWALALSVPEQPVIYRQPAAIAILWHPAAPLTDWTPHTSTVLH